MMKSYAWFVCLSIVLIGGALAARGEEKNAGLGTIVFLQVQEPKENAFTFLLPKGWLVEGGVFRVNPLAQSGPMNSIAAKMDIAVKKDPQGSVMGRWLPDIMYFDATNSPVGQMGLAPTGSSYNGMTVLPVMPAGQFLTQVVVPYLHPQAGDFQITEQRALPDLAQRCQQQVLAMLGQYGSSFSYDAGLLGLTYTEGGVRYEEKIVTVVENWGQLGAGMWGNKETFCLRTPAGQFELWGPVFRTIQTSVKLNPQWVAAEMRGQMDRAAIVRKTQQEIQQINQEIIENRQKTNAEINNDMYLTLTDQEEYVNPHTNEVEVGSNQWKYRWENESGEIVYTDDGNYNPNQDPAINRTDYKVSEVRPRFPN